MNATALLNPKRLAALFAFFEPEEGSTVSAVELFLRRLHLTLLNTRGYEDAFVEVMDAGFIQHFLALPAVQTSTPTFAVGQVSLETTLSSWKEMRGRLVEYVYQLTDYELYHWSHEELHRRIERELRRRHEAFFAQQRQRCAVFKKELMAAAWRPARLEAALAAGVDVDEM